MNWEERRKQEMEKWQLPETYQEELSFDEWLQEQGLDWRSGPGVVLKDRPKEKELLEEGYKKYEKEQKNLRKAIVFNLLERNGVENQATDYAEPGYDAEGKGILFHNWNDVPGDTRTALEEFYNLEWSDEWLVCDCGKAFRCSPDSYSWTCYGWVGDGDCSCGDCVREEGIDFVEKELVNNPDRVDTIGLDLEKLGFLRLEENFDYGLREGNSNYDPKKILSLLQKAVPGVQVVFGGLSACQFENSFRVFVRHPDKTDRQLEKIISHLSFAGTASPGLAAKNIKKGLKEAARQQGELKGEGVKYSKIDSSTGKVKTRLIPPDEFIEKGTKE